MISRVLSVSLLLHFTVWVNIATAALQETDCDDRTKSEVENYFGSQMGVSATEIGQRLIVADMLSDRSFTKTWATTLTQAQYQGINFGPTIVKENKHRFSYPQGEASGGYRNTNIPNIEPYKTWEMRAREVMQFTYTYLLQLSEQITGFGDLLPVRPTLDGGCEQRFHATHAELKLLTRLMRQGSISEGDNVIMSVSRHMCGYCKPIVAHLARNGRRRIAIMAPRKKTKGSKKSIDQPEYILFEADGSFTRYTRKTANAASSYECKKTTFTGTIPAGLDTYHPPDPNFQPSQRQIHQRTVKLIQALNRSAEVTRQGLKTKPNFANSDFSFDETARVSSLTCPDESEGPGNECITYLGTDLPKTVDCPRPETMTGIHGTFGPLKPENPVIVLKSIGSFCEVSRKVPAMGSPSVTPFELKCPEDHQLTGFHGRFGLLVDQIGIICRRISDGSQWKSIVAGTSSGGSPKEQECESGAAGRQIKLWPNEAVDGLGLCCR